MDSLANYGSDDDYEDSSDEKATDWRQTDRSINKERQEDANYEEVQMDLSEDSNDAPRNGRESGNKDSAVDDKRNLDSLKYTRTRDRCRSRSRDRNDDKGKDTRDDTYSQRSDRYNRDERNYNKKDSYRDRKYQNSSNRSRRRSSSRERRRSNSRDRKRSQSRERYRRSPKRDRSRSRRSRSRSWGRYNGSQRKYGYSKNSPRNEPTETSTENQTAGSNDKDRFFMPGITGKYREQIEKRKLLWQKKDGQNQAERATITASKPVAPVAKPSTSRVTKIWETTTFAQDQDGKVASKFKRLMGIKGQAEAAETPRSDIIKKQEEMFTSMEHQYEVARTATHTMRGVGLGFTTSYSR